MAKAKTHTVIKAQRTFLLILPPEISCHSFALTAAIMQAAEDEGYTAIYPVQDDFREMILTAKQLAEPGDAVLLSPACASWGMFTDYEERGRIFKEIVNSL